MGRVGAGAWLRKAGAGEQLRLALAGVMESKSSLQINIPIKSFHINKQNLLKIKWKATKIMIAKKKKV